NLDDGEPTPATEKPGPLNALVGAFDGLHGDDRRFVDDDRLTDIQATHFFGDLPPEADIFPLLRVGLTPRQETMFHEQLRAEIECGTKLNTIPLELANDGEQQGVVF